MQPRGVIRSGGTTPTLRLPRDTGGPRHAPSNLPPPPLPASAAAGAALRKSGEKRGGRWQSLCLLPRSPPSSISLLFLSPPISSIFVTCAWPAARSARWGPGSMHLRSFQAGSAREHLRPRRQRAGPWSARLNDGSAPSWWLVLLRRVGPGELPAAVALSTRGLGGGCARRGGASLVWATPRPAPRRPRLRSGRLRRLVPRRQILLCPNHFKLIFKSLQISLVFD